MEVVVKIGNPIIVTEADKDKYESVIQHADNLKTVDYITLYPDKLEVISSIIKRTYKYPANLHLQWVLQKITDTSKILSDHYKTADKTSKRFVDLCIDILRNGGTVDIIEETFINSLGKEMIDKRVHLHLINEHGEAFNAIQSTRHLSDGCEELIQQHVDAKKKKDKEKEENERLKRLIEEKGLKV